MKTSVIQAFLLFGIIAGSQARLTPSFSDLINFSRQARQMFGQLTGFQVRNEPRYPLCMVDDTEGACLSDSRCEAERGRGAGFCGNSNDVCCIVEKTCRQATKAHGSTFFNPSYPNHDNKSQACPFTIHVDRGVCAVRLDFVDFELAPYGDGVCVTDTLTILGTKLGITTPVCGNMTSWTTTFEVEEQTDVTLAMVVQGEPPYKFKIRATQIACNDVVVFNSPTYSGVKNKGKIYTTTPAPTTTTPIPTTVTESSSTPCMEDDDDDDKDCSNESAESKETTTEYSEHTTLKRGAWPWPKPRDTVVELGSIVPFNEDEEGVYLESFDTTSAISAFKRAFDLKVADKCWQYAGDEHPIFRIVGGENTNLNEYPWQVALVYNNKFFCGGSLISDRHILTAAHCVFGSFSKGIDKLRVSLGDHDLLTKNETKNIVAGVKKVLFNVHYSPSTTAHDIAIFELDTPVNTTQAISPVKVPTDLGQLFEGEDATVTGWGRYNIRHKKTHPILKEHTAPIKNIDTCVERWNKFPGISAKKPNHVCLDVMYGTPCHGDSGGPLVVCGAGETPTCTQIGVVSFGFPLCTNIGLPAVFTRVSHYKPWMDMSLTQLNMHVIGEN